MTDLQKDILHEAEVNAHEMREEMRAAMNMPFKKIVKKAGIYKITNPKKKIYIGQSSNLNKRLLYYQGGHCKGQSKLYASIKRYGWAKHKFEIIHYCEPHELNKLEEYYISLYSTFDSKYGLNLTAGGDVIKLSPETILKRSLRLKGRVFTEEWKRKIGLKSIGRMVGFKHSEESKQKMRDNYRKPVGYVPYNKGKGYSKEEIRIRHNESNKRYRLKIKMQKQNASYSQKD